MHFAPQVHGFQPWATTKPTFHIHSMDLGNYTEKKAADCVIEFSGGKKKNTADDDDPGSQGKKNSEREVTHFLR